MKTTAILNQILIIGLFAVVTWATSSQDVKHELTQMDSTPFGHRLLDMIQVQMNTNADPVKTLLDLLNKLKASLLEERTKVEDANANQEADCKSTIPQLKTEIKLARRKKVYAENNKAAKKEELNGVELLLNENQKVLDKVNDYIKTVTTERDQDRKRYEDAISDIARIRDALKRAKEILGQINEKGDFSLVQMKDELHSMNFDYEYVKGIHKMALYFVEMAKAEPKELDHLYNVIDKIVAQLGENEFQLTQAESTKTKVFEAQMNQLNALQFEASAKVNNVKQTQQDLNNAILTIKNDVTHYDKTIELKSKEYADKKEQCRSNKDNHKKRTDDIAAQLDVIDQAIILIKENVEPLKEYVSHRDDK